MKISIKQMQPGMVLSSNVVTQEGRVLFSAKHAVTVEMINHLIHHNITAIEILDTQIPLIKSDESFPNVSIRSQYLPSISIQVSEDQMSATLIIEPSGPDNSNLSKQDILAVLKKENITTGIDELSIEKVVSKWNVNKHRYEIEDIAKGTLPEPGKEGAYHIKVRNLSNGNETAKIKKVRFMWELPDLIPYIQRVTPDTEIAERHTSIPSIPGKNIKGELIFTDEVIKTNLTIGFGVKYSPDGRSIVAEKEGVVSYVNDCIEVVFINFDGDVEVAVNKGATIAELLFHKAVEGGSMPGEIAIREQLKNSNVTHGIKEDILKEVVERLAQSDIPETPVIIAEAINPVNGKNGSLIFHFNTETSLKPKENPDGSVDYKSVNIVNSIAKGQKLVSISAPTTGIPGKNVCGETIACKDGTPAKLPFGSNTEADPSDPEVLLASIDGIVRYTGSTVEVTEGFIVKGNVDFSTGNVNYERSIVVNGDVKSGFEIECGGDFQAGGTIEDSVLKIGGNVLCRLGFSGQGKGIIDAKGDVNLGFMKNQLVRSFKSVNVAREAINSTIFAKGSIHIHGNPLSVAGGCLTARDTITVSTVGNHSGIRTLLEVGFDFTLGEDMIKFEEHLEDLLSNQHKIVENIKKIEKASSHQRKLSIKDQALKTKLMETLQKYKQQIELMELRKKVVLKKMYVFDNASIKIERMAFPGTLFKFGERHYLVKEEINGPKSVRLIEHEIRVL